MPIAGATTSTYTPVAGDVGKKLSVRVTASRAGWADRRGHLGGDQCGLHAGHAGGDRARARRRSATPRPTVGRGADVDAAARGRLPTCTFAYQWLADGAAIPGATGAGYTPVAGDVGKALAVRVTGGQERLHLRHRDVGGDRRRGSGRGHPAAPAAPAARRPRPRRRPRRRRPRRCRHDHLPDPEGDRHLQGRQDGQGSRRSGRPRPGVTVKYQWLRNGKAIKKATKASYKLTATDKGRKVSVKVTYSKAGLTTVVKTSAAKKVK